MHRIPYNDESIERYIYEDGDLAYFKVLLNKDKMIEDFKNQGLDMPFFLQNDSEVQIIFKRKKSVSKKS